MQGWLLHKETKIIPKEQKRPSLRSSKDDHFQGAIKQKILSEAGFLMIRNF